MALDFKVIPSKMREEMRPVRGGRQNQHNPLIESLLKGETVLIDAEDGKKIAGLYQSARIRGYKMTARKVHTADDDESKVGHMAWWTKIVEEGA